MPSNSNTTPAQRQLTAGLKKIKTAQDAGAVVFRSALFPRLQREALLAAGFLQPIIKGWYMASKPGEALGDTTPWFASMREFIGGYCDQRFRTAWHVSPDVSLLVHAGATMLPKQIIVHSPKGKNSMLPLPGSTSLLEYQAKLPTPDQIERVGSLRILTLPSALVRAPEVFFQTYSTDAHVALTQLADASDLNRLLLAGQHPVVAGRLAGAFRAAHRPQLSDDILKTMQAAGYVVTETNPFTAALPTFGTIRPGSPYILRLRLMWDEMRQHVLPRFPADPGLPADHTVYLRDVQDAYRADAYHSLSIEGYRVTDALIARVATGQWHPESHRDDEDAKNAMAAHGYWLAHNAVRESLTEILRGNNAGTIAERDHGTWYRNLFAPSVTAGILRAEDLAGYRNDAVYIKNATHVPPPKDAARDMMPTLFELLATEPSAGVRAVLGHYAFVFIHPYMDGNGRMGRFLMNTMLASGGYPWTVIPLEWRARYLAALEAASTQYDLGPFAKFIAECVVRHETKIPPATA